MPQSAKRRQGRRPQRRSRLVSQRWGLAGIVQCQRRHEEQGQEEQGGRGGQGRPSTRDSCPVQDQARAAVAVAAVVGATAVGATERREAGHCPDGDA
mmetsp:Transcript_16480/g.52458  ORF Transcript_16480/g.52458 Transcript_16480/m.52458 type:complete len:97 (+) Transcript_16480:194-484(+)